MRRKLLFILLLVSTFSFASPVFQQNSYRWREDNGNQTTATWKAALNTPTLPNATGQSLRLRMTVLETAAYSGSINTMPLQYRKNSGAWVTITNSNTNDFYFVNSANVTNNTATTQQISTGTFSAGQFKSDAANSTISIGISSRTEIEYCIARSLNYDQFGTYQFQISGLNNYSVYPTLNPICTTPAPTVSNVQYNINDTATPLTASGTSLLWYTAATGGIGSATAPTPSTSTLGATYFFVSQTLNGCEGPRAKLSVYVTDLYSTTATGKSLHFDGVDDRFEVANPDFTTTNNFTIDFWVNPEKTITIPGEANGGITGNSGQSYVVFPTITSLFTAVDQTQHAGAGVSVGTNGICVFEHTGGYLPSLLSWTGAVTGWTHVTVVYTNKQPSLYVNGVLVRTGLTSTINFVHAPANEFGGGSYIGHATYGPFKGSIDRLYILNTSTPPSAICEPNPNASNVVAFYNFNQGIASGNNPNETLAYDNGTLHHGELKNFALTGATSNWIADSSSTTLPVRPTVTTPITYIQGNTASQLTATGTNLLWYTSALTGATSTATAPTPSTATVGTTYYWVSSTNASGCESIKNQIAVIVTAPVPATHLNFDGVNDYVTIPTAAINNLPQGTISAWVFANGLDNQTICAKQSNGENSYAVFSIGGETAPNGKVFYKSKNGASIVSTATLVTGQWYHLAVSFTNTQAKLYVNGVLDNTVSGNFSLPNDLTVTATSIGAWLGDGGGQYFNGNIDEFRVWNKALTATDITNTMNCEAQAQPELIAYYKFNQGFNQVANSSVTTATDSAGSNTGTLNGFALSGVTSNWLSGSPVTTGNTCATLSNNEFTANTNFKVYPNPATNNVTIQFTDLNNAKLEVIDVTGKLLMKQNLNSNSNTVNIEQLPSGLYLFKVSSSEGTATTKVVKQ